MKRILWTTAILTAGLALAGCSGGADAPAESNQSATTTPATATTSELVVKDRYTNLPEATWDSAAEQSAKAAAETAAKAFVATGAGYESWWAGYAPLLDTSYATEAQYIDPARITVTSWSTVTVVSPTQNPVTVRVEFATNAGLWVMTLDRKSQSAPWLVMAFTRGTK